MLGIVGIAAALFVLALSLVITRMATVALTLTGLSREAARFQARSAFTGTGFTTGEAERVVDHPVRRRIIMGLMLLRSAGVVTIIISLILSLGGRGDPRDVWVRLGFLSGGVLLLFLLSKSEAADRAMTRLFQRFLSKVARLDTRDYASLLRLSGDYDVSELHVDEEDWIAGQRLHQSHLTEEGIIVLGVVRPDGGYVGAPQPSTEIRPGDTLLLYGHRDALEALDERSRGARGNQSHEASVEQQQSRVADQEREEQEREAEARGAKASG